MSNPLTAVINDLISAFNPVYQAWSKHLSTGSPLTVDTVGKNTYQLLEADLAAFGIGVLHLDGIGKRPEMSLLAEALANLRQHSVTMEHEKNIDYLTDKIRGELEGLTPTGSIRTPLSIRIAKEMEATGEYTKQRLDLKDAFLRFADLVIMRDGNLSKEELATLKSLDSILS